MVKELLIASNNPGKIEEIANLLMGLNMQLLVPTDLRLNLEVKETGSTYLENARLKAAAFCHAGGLPALADDTGLEVNSLNGAPGLHSKRYSPNPDATDADRRRLLLANLTGKPKPWTARFVCAVALALPNDRVIDFEGECRGEIIPEERGENGFGYDRIFLFPELGKTMAELNLYEKNRVSHRAKAILGILPFLREF